MTSNNIKIDSDAVRMLAELLRETDLTEIEYQIDSLKIKVSRTTNFVSVASGGAHHSRDIYAGGANQGADGDGGSNNVGVDGPSAYPKNSHDKELDDLKNHPGVIEAQMVGTVYLTPGSGSAPFVSVGSMVEQGQTLFIIEAMKVMNMIKAPRSGIIKHIFVRDAQPVEYGDPVCIID